MHSNALSVRKALGSPQQPAPEQYTNLEQCGRLTELEPARSINISAHAASLDFTPARQELR